MTNQDLSAKVAEARGETKDCTATECPYSGFDVHSEECHTCRHYQSKPYATDMNAAWGLVEEMKKGDDYWWIDCFSDGDYKLSVYDGESDLKIVGSASTMPRAICKAYLSWWKQCN